MGWVGSRVREVEREGGGGLAGAPPPTHPRQIDTTPIPPPLPPPQLYLLYIPTPKSPRLIIFAAAKEKSRKVREEKERETHVHVHVYIEIRKTERTYFFPSAEMRYYFCV